MTEIVELQGLLSVDADELLRGRLEHKPDPVCERSPDHNVGVELALFLVEGPHLELGLVKGSGDKEFLLGSTNRSSDERSGLLELDDLGNTGCTIPVRFDALDERVIVEGPELDETIYSTYEED